MDELFRADEVTRRLWQVLSTVQRNQPATETLVVNAMATSLGSTAETVGDLLTNLQQREWVDSHDGLWRLTEQGTMTYARLQDKVAQHRDRMFRGVPDDAYRMTVETLAQITNNLDPDGQAMQKFR